MFEEVQYFRRSKVAWILLGIMLLVLSGTLLAVYLSEDTAAMGIVLITNTIVFGVIGALFYFSKLETKITKDGLFYRYPIFVPKEKFISWDEVEQFEVRTYSPLREFGGWGYRKKPFSNSVCLNVSGNVGLDVKLKSGKQIMMGTQKESVLRDVLHKMKRDQVG